MTGDFEFAPILPQHAIERCAASVHFDPALPAKLLDKLAADTANRLQPLGFQSSTAATYGFQIQVGPDGGSGFTQLPAEGAPRLFSSPNQSTVLTLTTTSIVWQNSSYVRWQPFMGEFERIVAPLVAQCVDAVSVAAVRLEYWDRFMWSGDWSNFDHTKLLRQHSPYVVPFDARPDREWHSHTGWFSTLDHLRRLTNINIDVVEITNNPAIPARPSVGIYSMLMDQVNAPGLSQIDAASLGVPFVVDRLEAQHLELKKIFGHIIADDMANRIGLFSRTAPNAPV